MGIKMPRLGFLLHPLHPLIPLIHEDEEESLLNMRPLEEGQLLARIQMGALSLHPKKAVRHMRADKGAKRKMPFQRKNSSFKFHVTSDLSLDLETSSHLKHLPS